jgi:hypothetical protein
MRTRRTHHALGAQPAKSRLLLDASLGAIPALQVTEGTAMKQGRVAAAFVVSLGLPVACGPPEGNASNGGNILRALPAPVSVTGCLTASGDRVLLTALAPGEASEQLGRRKGERPYPVTEVYELTGANEKLRKYIGWHVRVHGEAPPPAVAIVREHSPAVAASPVAVGTAGQSPPQVRERGACRCAPNNRFGLR